MIPILSAVEPPSGLTEDPPTKSGRFDETALTSVIPGKILRVQTKFD